MTGRRVKEREKAAHGGMRKGMRKDMAKAGIRAEAREKEASKVIAISVESSDTLSGTARRKTNRCKNTELPTASLSHLTTQAREVFMQ
jgi:hypothetical protein